MLSNLIIISLLLLIIWILFSGNKSIGKTGRAVNMSLFSVDSPGELMDEEKFREIFKRFHHQGWNRLLYGEPYLSLERRTEDGEKEYYLGIPKYYEWLFSDSPNLSKTKEESVPEGGGWEIFQILVRHSHKRKDIFEVNANTLNGRNVENSFDFFLRVFENKKQVELSFTELKKNFIGIR